MTARINRTRRTTARLWTVLAAGAVLAAAGLAGCSSGASSDHAPEDAPEQEVTNETSSPTPTNSRETVQRAAHQEDPDKFCSVDDLDGSGWLDTAEGTMGFAYLPVFIGSKSEITSELDNEFSSSTYVPYSTDKILLTSTLNGSGRVPDETVGDIKATQVTEAIKDGALVNKCGEETRLTAESVGQTKIKYLHDGVSYTKYWTIWELSGDDFNPLPKDRNTTGFSMDISVGDETVHTMLGNNRARLPASFAQEGAATRTPDPGMALIRYYYQHHVWE